MDNGEIDQIIDVGSSTRDGVYRIEVPAYLVDAMYEGRPQQGGGLAESSVTVYNGNLSITGKWQSNHVMTGLISFAYAVGVTQEV